MHYSQPQAPPDSGKSTLYSAVSKARAHLREVEAKHDLLVASNARDLVAFGRQYAFAVQDYMQVTMAWLGSIDIQHNRERTHWVNPETKCRRNRDSRADRIWAARARFTLPESSS